jgi:protein phosphatase
MASRERSAGPVVASICGRTHRGRVRADNQDRLLVAGLADGARAPHTADTSGRGSAVGPLTLELDGRGAVLLVADGMGGRAGGARASALAVAAVHRVMTSEASALDGADEDAFVACLRSALTEANRDILEEAGREMGLRGMGTTATLAGIRAPFVYLAHVGDSRAYVVRAGALTQLTRDQSLVQDLIDAGMIDEGDKHTVGSNVILQALGVTESVQPEVTYHELRRGDVLLLCSDGLSQVVGDDEIRQAMSQSPDCLTMCDRLVGMANDRGGPDNVTVLVARIDGDGLEPPSSADAVERRAWG